MTYNNKYMGPSSKNTHQQIREDSKQHNTQDRRSTIVCKKREAKELPGNQHNRRRKQQDEKNRKRQNGKTQKPPYEKSHRPR